MLPVQVDAWYRSGASGIAISVASLALATGALASLLLRLTGSLTACADRRGADHPEPERPVPAEHADDRAVAVRSLIPGSCGDRSMAGRLSSAHTVGGRGDTGGCLSDAVRGVGDHRRRHCARQRTVAAARASGSRDSARQCVARTLAGHSHYRLHYQQPLGRWRLVRHGRILRTGERRRDRQSCRGLAADR